MEDDVKALCIAALFAASYAVDSGPVAPMHPCKPHENSACATHPKIVRHVEPEYSEHGRKKKINGTVVLTFTVLPDGTTADIIVTRRLEKSLDEQAIKAVRQWRFEPGTYQNQPPAPQTGLMTAIFSKFDPRAITRRGEIIAIQQVGGLHHRYERRAA